MNEQQRNCLIWVLIALAGVSHVAFFEIPIVEFDPTRRQGDFLFFRARQREDVRWGSGTRPRSLGGAILWGFGLPALLGGAAWYVAAGKREQRSDSDKGTGTQEWQNDIHDHSDTPFPPTNAAKPGEILMAGVAIFVFSFLLLAALLSGC